MIFTSLDQLRSSSELGRIVLKLLDEFDLAEHRPQSLDLLRHAYSLTNWPYERDYMDDWLGDKQLHDLRNEVYIREWSRIHYVLLSYGVALLRGQKPRAVLQLADLENDLKQQEMQSQWLAAPSLRQVVLELLEALEATLYPLNGQYILGLLQRCSRRSEAPDFLPQDMEARRQLMLDEYKAVEDCLYLEGRRRYNGRQATAWQALATLEDTSGLKDFLFFSLDDIKQAKLVLDGIRKIDPEQIPPPTQPAEDGIRQLPSGLFVFAADSQEP